MVFYERLEAWDNILRCPHWQMPKGLKVETQLARSSLWSFIEDFLSTSHTVRLFLWFAPQMALLGFFYPATLWRGRESNSRQFSCTSSRDLDPGRFTDWASPAAAPFIAEISLCNHFYAHRPRQQRQQQHMAASVLLNCLESTSDWENVSPSRIYLGAVFPPMRKISPFKILPILTFARNREEIDGKIQKVIFLHLNNLTRPWKDRRSKYQ